MKLGSARPLVCASAIAVIVLLAAVLRGDGGGPSAQSAAGGQATSAATPLLAEQAFKNIQALKGISVDDFMGTMGIMSAALGFDCAECHDSAGTDKVNWAADTQRKVTALKMVNKVTTIHRAHI